MAQHLPLLLTTSRDPAHTFLEESLQTKIKFFIKMVDRVLSSLTRFALPQKSSGHPEPRVTLLEPRFGYRVLSSLTRFALPQKNSGQGFLLNATLLLEPRFGYHTLD